VVNPLQDENLGHEALLQLLIEAKRGDLLDRHLGPVHLVPPVPHNRERPRADLLPHHVVSHHPAPPRRLRHRRRQIPNPRLRKRILQRNSNEGWVLVLRRRRRRRKRRRIVVRKLSEILYTLSLLWVEKDFSVIVIEETTIVFHFSFYFGGFVLFDWLLAFNNWNLNF